METYEVHITQTVERTIMVKSHSQAEAEIKAYGYFFMDSGHDSDVESDRVTKTIVSSTKLS